MKEFNFLVNKRGARPNIADCPETKNQILENHTIWKNYSFKKANLE